MIVSLYLYLCGCDRPPSLIKVHFVESTSQIITFWRLKKHVREKHETSSRLVKTPTEKIIHPTKALSHTFTGTVQDIDQVSMIFKVHGTHKNIHGNKQPSHESLVI